jgi:hypothetical protein
MNNINLFLLPLVAAAAVPWVIAWRCRAAGTRLTERPDNALPPARPRRRWGRVMVALLLVLYALLVFKEDLWYLWQGEPAQGTVVKEGKYGRSYEFRDAAGKLHRAQLPFSYDRFPVGESVHVRYLADNPKDNRLIQSWPQRDLVSAFVFPIIAFAWYGWVYLVWVWGCGAWRALAEQYPDIGAGEGWRPWWSQGARFDNWSGQAPLRLGNTLTISAGANGLRFTGMFPFRYLLMLWHPAFVIPWSDLRAEPAGPEGVRLRAARVPGVAITISAELANGIASHVGDAWPAAETEAPPPAPQSQPSPQRQQGHPLQADAPAGTDDPSKQEMVAAGGPASQASIEAFFASLQGGPAQPGQLPVQPGGEAPVAKPRSAPPVTLETRGRTCTLPPTTLRNVGLSTKEGYQAVVSQFARRRLDYKSSGESFLMLVMAVVGWLAIAGWLYNAYGLPIAFFVTILCVMFGFIPLASRLLGQRRVRMDRSADAVHVRQFFRERFLCRVSDILAVQVVGDGNRVEVNLALGDRPRINLAALKKSDNRRRLLEHARQLADFLEVPLVDQVEARTVAGPEEKAGTLVGGTAGTVIAPERRPADEGLAEPVAARPGEQLPVRLQGSLWYNFPEFMAKLYGSPGNMWLKSDRTRLSLFLIVTLLNLLLIAGALVYFFGQGAALAIAAVAVAVVALRLIPWWQRRRLSRVIVEVSDHPLSAGEGHGVVVCHPDPRGLKGVYLDLVRMDLCFLDELLPRHGPPAFQKVAKRVLPSRLRTKVGVEHCRQSVPLAPPEDSSGARQGRVEIPSAAGSLGLGDQRVLWGLEVRLGRWSRWAAFYPVAIKESAQEPRIEHRGSSIEDRKTGASRSSILDPRSSMRRGTAGWKASPVARGLRVLGTFAIGAAVLFWGVPALLKVLIPADPVLSVAFSPDGQRLATASFDGRKDVSTVKIWDAATGKELLTLEGQAGLVESLAFSPHGKRLASASPLDVKVWDTATGREMHTFPHQRKTSTSVAFSPHGKRLASASDYRNVKVWDVASGRELRTFPGHAHGVRGVAFSPHGKRLVTAGGKSVKVWDAASGRRLGTLKSGAVWGVAFSPSGKRLATAGSDGTIKLWDAATFKRRRTLKGHAKAVRSVAFSRDGQRLASGSSDGTVKVWDTATGKELLTVKGHPRYVWRMAFSPDGQRLASGSKSGPAKVWDAVTGQELLTLK